MTNLVRMLAVVALAATAAPAALAGGDDYDLSNDPEGKGPAYYGFVRDTRGSAVSEARVVLQPKTGEPVILKSNKLGAFRSHLSKDVAPEEVQLQCDKDGYKQTQVLRRPGSSAANIEINCTLQRL